MSNILARPRQREKGSSSASKAAIAMKVSIFPGEKSIEGVGVGRWEKSIRA